MADSILAVTRRELHPFITSSEVQEGSLVLLTKYHLASGKKVQGNGNVWYERSKNTVRLIDSR